MFAIHSDPLHQDLPIGSGVPWKCVLSPEMEILGCVSGHGMQGEIDILLEAQGL